ISRLPSSLIQVLFLFPGAFFSSFSLTITLLTGISSLSSCDLCLCLHVSATHVSSVIHIACVSPPAPVSVPVQGCHLSGYPYTAYLTGSPSPACMTSARSAQSFPSHTSPHSSWLWALEVFSQQILQHSL